MLAVKCQVMSSEANTIYDPNNLCDASNAFKFTGCTCIRVKVSRCYRSFYYWMQIVNFRILFSNSVASYSHTLSIHCPLKTFARNYKSQPGYSSVYTIQFFKCEVKTLHTRLSFYQYLHFLFVFKYLLTTYFLNPLNDSSAEIYHYYIKRKTQNKL